MRNVRKLIAIAVFVFPISAVLAQGPRPFGLQGHVVRDLAVSPGSLFDGRYLYAATEKAGVFRRNLASPDSDWVYLGLAGKHLRSIGLFRWGVGPRDFEYPVVGLRAQPGDSALLYVLTPQGWTPADSGINWKIADEVRAIASFSSGGHMPAAPMFAAVGGRLYRNRAPWGLWERVFDLGMGAVNAICVSDPRAFDGPVWIGGENAIFAPWIARSTDGGGTWQISFPNVSGDNACDALAVRPGDGATVYAGLRGTVLVSGDSGRSWSSTSMRNRPLDFTALAVDVGTRKHVWAGGPATPGNARVLWETLDGGRTWLPVQPPSGRSWPGISRLVADPAKPGRVYIATLGDGVWIHRTPFTNEALALALSLQRQGVQIDLDLVAQVAHLLAIARTAHDTLRTIHARAEYDPASLMVRSTASWTQPWQQGQLWTGYAPIDSLDRAFGLIRVQSLLQGRLFVLHFFSPYRTPGLAEIYKAVPGVDRAYPNWNMGDGDWIKMFQKGHLWYFVFSEGWGDCYSGCTGRNYWYVLVGADSSATLVDMWDSDDREARLDLWNIPPRYVATCFEDLEALSRALESPDWWVRRHAVVVLGRLASRNRPWTYADEIRRQQFDRLRQNVRASRAEVLARLRPLLLDPDEDVRAAARVAINQVLGFSPQAFDLYFPLRVGNRWTFDHGHDWVVMDSVVVDSLSYHRLDQSGPLGEVLVRWTGDGRLLALDSSGCEQVWLDFRADVGQSWRIRNPQGLEWTVELQSKDDTVSVPAGDYIGCYRFWYHFDGADADWVEWYAPGVGPVKRVLFGFAVTEYRLQSAEVCGVHIPTSVAGGKGNDPVPARFALLPGYPNPARGKVRLRYMLPHAARVRLSVFDALGRLVRTRDLGQRSPGYHSIVWEATDDAARPLPSGVYLVRLEAGAQVAIRKVVLVR